MNHADFLGIFQRELDRLGGNLEGISIRDLLLALEKDGSRRVDLACKIFAATRSWPPLSGAERIQVVLRLSCAAWYCDDMLAKDGDDNFDDTLLSFAESVLIDYWRDNGRRDWLREAFADKEDPDKQRYTHGPPPPGWN